MRRTRRSEGSNALHNPRGELIYELVGLPAALGGSTRHSVAEIVIPPGGSSSRHWHKVSEETYYILKGTGVLHVDLRSFPVSAGDVVWIEPGERHQIENPCDAELVFVAITAPPWRPDDSVPA